jgi:hypothetical protein
MTDELTPTAAGARTLIQGFSIPGLLGLLMVFNVVRISPDQAIALAPFLAGAGALIMRIVENKLGKGLFRTPVAAVATAPITPATVAPEEPPGPSNMAG